MSAPPRVAVSSTEVVLPLVVSGPDPVCAPFEDKLQVLVSDFWSGRDDDMDSTLDGLQHLFISLARELGRVDGVARICGVPREESLRLLRAAYVEGKRAALAQHKRASEDCSCQPAAVLLQEIESN